MVRLDSVKFFKPKNLEQLARCSRNCFLKNHTDVYCSIKASEEEWGDPQGSGWEIAIWSHLLDIFIEIIGNPRPTSITVIPQRLSDE